MFQAEGTVSAKALSKHKQKRDSGDEVREGIRDGGGTLAISLGKIGHWRSDIGEDPSDIICSNPNSVTAAYWVENSLRWELGPSRERGCRAPPFSWALPPAKGSVGIYTALPSLFLSPHSPCLQYHHLSCPSGLSLWGQSSTAPARSLPYPP